MDDIATIDSIQRLVIHQNVKWGILESTAHDVRGVTQAEYKKTNPGHGQLIVDSWKRFRDSNLRMDPKLAECNLPMDKIFHTMKLHRTNI